MQQSEHLSSTNALQSGYLVTWRVAWTGVRTTYLIRFPNIPITTRLRRRAYRGVGSDRCLVFRTVDRLWRAAGERGNLRAGGRSKSQSADIERLRRPWPQNRLRGVPSGLACRTRNVPGGRSCLASVSRTAAGQVARL